MTHDTNQPDQPIRVLHVVRDLEPESGGPSRSVPQLAAALQELGTFNSLVYLDRGGSTTSLPTSVVAFPIRSQGFLRWKNSAENRVHLERLANVAKHYDIVHLHGTWDRLVHQVAGQAFQQHVPYVWAPRGMLEPWSLQQKYWKKKIAWWLYLRRDFQRATRLHATSELEAKNLGQLRLRPPCFTAANGIVFPLALPPRPSHPSRQALFLSRIHPKKGVELLIEAWHQVRPAGWTCQIVGPAEPSYLATLREQVARHGLSEQLLFRGEADDQAKWQLYRSADLFILPTFSENFGIVIAEALAMGTPVITTTGTPWYELATKHCGWCVAPTVPAIADALQDATGRSPDHRQQMGQNGMTWMQAEFGWPGIAARVQQEYRQILRV